MGTEEFHSCNLLFIGGCFALATKQISEGAHDDEHNAGYRQPVAQGELV